MIPNKIKNNDQIEIIAPSGSIWRIEPPLIDLAKNYFLDKNYKVVFSKNIYELNEFDTSSVEQRIEDLHNAFENEKTKMILCAIGGCSSNQLLDYIDYELVKKNPKIFCGYSDITILANAIFKMTGMVTYLGPNFVNFAVKKGFKYTERYFWNTVKKGDIQIIKDSDIYSDDRWYIDQDDRNFLKNDGRKIINGGYAYGRIIGGNFCSFQLLQGTKYFPDLKNSIIFLEDDDLVGKNFIYEFDRNLQSLIQQPDFDKVKAIIIGRNQLGSKVNNVLFEKVIRDKKELKGKPIIYNLDFGHTQPFFTIPIGGYCEINNGIIKISDRDFKKEEL